MNAQPRYHFSTEFSRFFNNLLNRAVFSLWKPLARLRALSLLLLFFFIWHTLANRYTPIGFWDSLRSLLFGLQMQDWLIVRDTLVNFIWRHLFDLEALRDIVPIVFPFLLMRYRAAAYLEDIFELDDPEAALRFVDSAAFGIRYDSIVIQQGDVIREHRGSSILRIGGPGYVKVALDSAALFEYPDGRPHVVTARKQVITLDGFERLQDIFDLRDHTYTFSVRERSLDGIWVEARDVRLIFSIWRGEKKSSLEEPYPVAPQALEALFYDDASSVGQTYARTLHRPWPLKMQGLISGQLRSFIRSNLLENFIASQEPPRLDDATGASPPDSALGSAQPHFFSRSEISGQVNLRADVPNYFLLFAQNFNARAKRQGVELKWNGIGTWILPDETLQRHNLEAWYLTRKNLQRMSPHSLQRERESASIEKLRAVVQKYVINPDIGNRAFRTGRWQKDVYHIIRLLQDAAREDCPAAGMPVGPLKDAVKVLRKTRSRTINEMFSQRTPTEAWPPESEETPYAEAEALGADGQPDEANPVEEVLKTIRRVLGVENTRTVLADMRRMYGEETDEANLVGALAICLGEAMADFEKSQQTPDPDMLTIELRRRIQEGECPPES